VSGQTQVEPARMSSFTGIEYRMVFISKGGYHVFSTLTFVAIPP
jgi:hypothetical protein